MFIKILCCIWLCRLFGKWKFAVLRIFLSYNEMKIEQMLVYSLMLFFTNRFLNFYFKENVSDFPLKIKSIFSPTNELTIIFWISPQFFPKSLLRIIPCKIIPIFSPMKINFPLKLNSHFTLKIKSQFPPENQFLIISWKFTENFPKINSHFSLNANTRFPLKLDLQFPPKTQLTIPPPKIDSQLSFRNQWNFFPWKSSEYFFLKINSHFSLNASA